MIVTRVFETCLFFTCSCACFIILYHNNLAKGHDWRDDDFQLNRGENEIIILSWTTNWGSSETVKVRNSSDCPYLNTSLTKGESSGRTFTVPCRFTYDRRYLNQSDSVIFHSWDMQHTHLPKRISDNQIWVYLQLEPPGQEHIQDLDLSKYSNIFNWTMTYRRDSDVYHPYGHFIPLQEENNNFVIRPEWKNRTNLVAWIVTNCEANSKREKVVEQLQRFIPVVIYGKCGIPCPPRSHSTDCFAIVHSTHKFYLSFENSLCLDYITEKFIYALQKNMVPVVYGGYNSSDYSAIAPKGSYIDARDFQSVKELADYLIYLDQNDDEYEKYFQWRRKFYFVTGYGWCNLCQRLFEERLKFKRERKQYTDLMKWWNNYDNGYGSFSPVCSSPVQRLILPEHKK